jgi:Tol biopolymer transport system component
LTLTPGTKLGPYEIVAPLGAGGMGEVYRARDSRLGRDVAIKVLPQHLSANPEVRARFEREAKTVSSLNHPNICTLFDVGREGETDYLVMELVEGETLSARITRGALPPAEVLRIGSQVADALDRAHRAGVIHRDLKPGNVMLTKSGAKLMDFGLARATGLAGPASGSGITGHPATPGPALTQSPTVAGPLTAEGTIVGTFQYMAPEQLEGKEADARSDIWALGCVLYEMASGRRAFSGASQASLIGAIMNVEPRPLGEIAPDPASPGAPPAALERLVKQCLAKDPDDRWQSARDLARELGSIAPDSGTGKAAVVSAPRRFLTAERTAWAAMLVLVAAGSAYFARTGRPAAGAHVVSSIELPPGLGFSVKAGPPALSPDGRSLAFAAEDSAATTSLWVRSMDEPEPRALPGTANAESPFWSPDGRDLGFFADGQLKRIAAAGGSPQVLAPAPRPRGGAWGRDGSILFVGHRDAGIERVPATGGEVSTVIDTSRKATVREPNWPAPLPDGRHFLFTMNASTTYQGLKDGVYVASMDRAEPPRLILPGAMNATYSGSGRLFFWRDGTLWSQAFDARRLSLSGAAIQAAADVVLDPGYGAGLFSASFSGTLVYLRGSSVTLSELAWVDRSGRDQGRLGPAASYYGPRISHDGRRVAVDRSDPVSDQGDIWVFDVARNLGDRLTSDPMNETAPAWSPDDSRLYWMSAVAAAGGGDIHTRTFGGGDRETTVYRSPDANLLGDCAPDGASLVFSQATRSIGGSSRLVVLSLADGKASTWLDTPFNERCPRLSRDGQWILYTSDESGQPEVYVQRFPQGGERWRVSTSGGSSPVWRADGRELFYVERDRRLMAVPFHAEPSVEVGTPVPLFRSHFLASWLVAAFDAAPGGQRFLLDRVVGGGMRHSMTLEQGWAPPR